MAAIARQPSIYAKVAKIEQEVGVLAGTEAEILKELKIHGLKLDLIISLLTPSEPVAFRIDLQSQNEGVLPNG